MKGIYSDINAPVIITEIKIAELSKYINNAFHALKICFANEVGTICKKLDIDSHSLMEIFCMDHKLNISSYYLKPGFAYGGSCLPKDLKALNTIAHDNYLNTPLIDSIDRSNENLKASVLDQIIALDKKKIGIFGLSFKAGTDDLRNSPIVDIIERLIGKGYKIKIYDANVHFSQLMGANRDYIMKKIPYISQLVTNRPDEVIDHAELIILVHATREFSELLDKVDPNTVVFDLAHIAFNNKSNLKHYLGIAW
jgi:GDP-mannose 6-dehydrogenase